MKTLSDLIAHLEKALEHAKSPECCVLILLAGDNTRALLANLKDIQEELDPRHE